MDSEYKLILKKQALGDDENNLIHVRILLNVETKQIEKFSVVYIHIGTKGEVNLFQADGSTRERVNAHHYYQNPPRKEYHTHPLTTETIQKYVDQLTQNWRWYLAQYKQNYI
jgi:hypothetical protein